MLLSLPDRSPLNDIQHNLISGVVKEGRNAEEEEQDSVKQCYRTLYKSVCKTQQCAEKDSDKTRQREMKEFNVRREQGSFLHEW